jgi:hypothetical protein
MRSEYTERYCFPDHSQTDLGVNVKEDSAPATNTRVFGILLILMQIAVCLLYGFLVWVPSSALQVNA